MYKICLSLAFSPQTGTWGKTRGKLTAAAHLAQNLWTIMMRLTRSTWNPSPTFKESRLDSDEGQHYGDPSLRLPGSQLVQSEVRRVGLGLATPLKAWHLAHDFVFFCLVGLSPQKKTSHQAKRSESLQLFFLGGKAFWSIQMPISAWLMKNPQAVLLLHPKNSRDFVVSRG